MTARLGQHALARIDQDHGHVGGGGAGDHVAGVLLVPRRVGDDELAPFGGEEPIGHVDGDALLALGLQAIHQQGEVDLPALGAHRLGVRLQRRELVLEDHFGVVEQPPDQGRLAIVHRPAGDEPEERLGLVARQIGVDVAFEQVCVGFGGGKRGSSHQKYPSCFLLSIVEPSRSITRPWRSELLAEEHFLDDAGERIRFALDRAGQGIAAEGAEAHRTHFGGLARLQRHPRHRRP